MVKNTSDKLPITKEEIADIFFGDNNLKQIIDEFANKPKKITKRRSKKQIKHDLEISLIRQTNFIKRFYKNLNKRKKEEVEFEENLEVEREYKAILQQEKIKRRVQKKYTEKCSSGERDCFHIVNFMINGTIFSTCKYCSKEKQWDMANWQLYVTMNANEKG